MSESGYLRVSYKINEFIRESDYQLEWKKVRNKKELFRYTKAINKREEVTQEC